MVTTWFDKSLVTPSGGGTIATLADHFGGITAALALKAPLASPTFTGVVTAPTFVGALTGTATSAIALAAGGADRIKLDGIAVGATANSTDAQLRDRATHTGTQLVTTISNLGAGTVTATGGTTSRTLSARFADELNVRDYGATGDGVTNDRAAIVAAQTAASALGWGLYVPPGTYVISGSDLTQTVPYRFAPGAMLSIAAGRQFFVRRALIAGAHRIFTGAGVTSWFSDVSPDIGLAEWWGAVGDNTTDDTAALQAAINSGVYTVALTNSHRITAPLVMDRSNCGIAALVSARVPLITLDDATGLLDNIQIGNAVSVRTTIRLDGIGLARTQAATAGAAIRMQRANSVTFDRLTISGGSKIFNGIVGTECVGVLLHNCALSSTVSDLITWSGSATIRSIDLKFDGSLLQLGGGVCVKMNDYCEGLFIKDCILYNFVGAIIDLVATVQSRITVVKIQNTDLDSCSGPSFRAVKADNIMLTGVWMSNVNGGVDATSIDQLNVIGCHIYAKAGYSCILADGPYHLQVVGSLLSGGSASPVTAVTITGTSRTPKYVQVTANMIRSVSVGVALTAAPTNGYDIEGNFMPDTVTTPYTGYTQVWRPETTGNVGLNGASYGGGTGVLYVANATTVPTTNPTGGGVLYAEGGNLKWRSDLGTVTTIAPA